MIEQQHCELTVEWSADSAGVITLPVPAPTPGLERSIEEGWTPEHLLLASLGLSFMSTFYELARSKQCAPQQFRGTAEGLVELADGVPTFRAFTLWLRVDVGVAQKALALDLLERARRGCVVSRELKAPIDVFHEVRGVRPRKARGTPRRVPSPDARAVPAGRSRRHG